MDKELYLKTAFCCMVCDGNIAEEEVQLIRDYTLVYIELIYAIINLN